MALMLSLVIPGKLVGHERQNVVGGDWRLQREDRGKKIRQGERIIEIEVRRSG